MGNSFTDYLGDLQDDIEDYLEDFFDHLTKPKKIHKKLKKKTRKKGRVFNHFAERIKGFIYLILGLTLGYSAVIATTDGIAGVQEIAGALISSMLGRVLLVVVGVAYIVHGIWKIVCGGE